MKKFVSLLLAIVIAAGALIAAPIQLPGLVVSASAQEATTQPETTTPETTEPTESLFTYELNTDKNGYTVTGYTGDAVDELVIPAEYEGKPVTMIGESAFESNKNFNKVNLPSTIVKICYSAFFRTNIKEIVIPDSVVSLGSNTLADCPQLETVVLSKNLKKIESYTFRGSNKITEIVIPNGVKTIESEAFRLCSGLEKITIPDTVNRIGSDAFSDCSKLKSIVLPKNLKEIAYQTFIGCTSLEEVVVQDGTKSIGYNAFKNCTNLSKVTLPDSIERIYTTAFEDTKIYTDKSNWENGVLYIGNYIIATDNTLPEMYRVKDGTVGIAERAFYNAKNTASVFLPKSIKSIDRQAFWGMPLAFIFYEGTIDDFNKIKFTDGQSELENTLVILEADGTGIPAKATVKSVSNAAGGVLISWNPVENADAYVVWRRGAGTSDWTLLGITTETSAIDTSAEHRKFWRYSVQAMNADGLSDFDYTGKHLKYIETPELTGISNVKNGLKFTWKAVSGATGYRVYRRSAGAKGWRYLGTVKGTSYTDTGVRNANGGYYRYTVRAVVDKRYSGYEDFLYLKRLSNPTLKSAKSTGNGILVDWGSVKGSTGYYVYRKTAGSSWTRIATVKGVDNSAYTDTTAKKGVTYTYTVRAYSGKARSHYNSGIKCTR